MTGTKPGKNNMLPETYGLVICGGNSIRMGTDKSMLIYHQKPQRYHVYEMLQPFCEKNFISCKEEQANTITAGYNILTDYSAYNNIGPMAALLTAFTRFPQKNILFIGCDYPFLTTTCLQQFSTYCAAENAAVGFYNEKEGLYEPLLAWYPYQSFDKLKQMHEAKQFSLQHFLRDNKAVKYFPADKNSMVSIDTHESFIKASKLINSG